MDRGSPLCRAYRYCEWITYRHYENFPVASWLLPRELRPHIAAVYAFARSADDFADESRYQGRSLELLERWRASLRACANGGGPEHPVFTALADTVRRRELPVRLLDDLLTAFTMDVTKRRYTDWEDLLNYCKHSAHPVGRLVLLLSGIRDEELHRLSDDICTALQLVNHWQDLRIDLTRDMLYIPKTLMDQHGVSEQELKEIAADRIGVPGSFQVLMKELVGRARALFDSGEPLVKHLKGGLRLEIKLTLLGGRTLLDRIESVDYDVFRRRPLISTVDKMCLLTRALLS